VIASFGLGSLMVCRRHIRAFSMPDRRICNDHNFNCEVMSGLSFFAKLYQDFIILTFC